MIKGGNPIALGANGNGYLNLGWRRFEYRLHMVAYALMALTGIDFRSPYANSNRGA